MKKLNVYIALGGVCLSLILLVIIPYQISAVGSNVVGMTAQTFPRFCAIGVLLSSLGLLFTTLIENKKEAAPEVVKAEEIKVFKDLALIIIYAIAMNFVGFFLSTLIMGSIFMILHKDKVWYHHVIYYVVIIISYILFTKFLYIHLPKLGIWIF